MKKTAFITGGAGYIGGAIARRFAAEGMNVAIGDINEEKLKETADAITAAGGSVRTYVMNMRDSASVDAAVNAAYADFGRLDIMVHVAGGSARGRMKLLIEQTDDVIEDVIGVNLMGAFWADRAAARIMVKQNEGGRIVDFASVVGLCGVRKSADYAASKGGVMSLVKALAKELGEYGITVNAVAPGIVVRPDEKNQSDQRTKGTNLLGVRCTAEDIASMVDYICSDEAHFITGQTYVVDGGRSLSLKGTD